MNKRYFIKLAYLGTRYHGWQRQDNAVSVQEVLEKALKDLFGFEIETVGCGRTDTGVHASEFFAHADLPSTLDPAQAVYKLNRMLPKDIAVHEILKAEDKAHARFDAIRRTYEYRVLREKDPFKTDLTYYYYGELDVAKMNSSARILFEYNDFGAFSKSNTDVNNNLCTIHKAKWIERENELVFTISANRFLRNMVRAIVGTLLEAGRGRMDESGMRKIIEGKDRSDAGASVPASGLFLKKIDYPESVFVK